MLLWRNPTQYMCGCGFGNHIEPSYWTLKWFVIFLPLIVTFHLFRSLWGHCGQLSKKCVGPGATRESPYGHLGPLWPQTHLIPCGKANRSHTGKFGTPQWSITIIQIWSERASHSSFVCRQSLKRRWVRKSSTSCFFSREALTHYAVVLPLWRTKDRSCRRVRFCRLNFCFISRIQH